MDLTIEQISKEAVIPEEFIPFQLSAIEALKKLGKFEDSDKQVIENLNKDWHFYSKRFARETR